MMKKMKKLLSWLVVLALVLPMVPAFTLPASAAKTETKASTINYGSTNLDAIANASEKALVQERIALLEQMIANPQAAMQQLANYCPVCNAAVTWEEWTGAVALSGGQSKHLIVTSDRAITAAWPLEFYGDGAKAHVLLAANVQLSGPILCNSGCTNTDITIFGTGSITSGRLFRPLGNAKLTLIGGTYIPTSATYPTIDAMSCTEGAQINIYPHTVLGPATKDAEKVITNIKAKYATINMYGGEIRNGQSKDAEMGGNIGLQTNSVLNMYGGTVSNGSNSSAKGGNIASYSSSATINIYGGTVSGGSGTAGANLYGFGPINIGGTALITGATAINSGSGANVYQTGAKTLSISGGKIEGGNAYWGGNVYVHGTAKLIMTDGVIAGGTSTQRGGNIFADAGTTVSIKGATITGGTGSNGGNISTAASATIEDSVITDGSATGSGSGGNLYFHGGEAQVVQISNTTISGGKADIGANLHVTESSTTTGTTVVLNNCTIGAAKAAENISVGVYWGSKLAVVGGTISAEGNAVRLAKSQVVLTGNATVSGAPAIYVDGNSTLALEKSWTGKTNVYFAKTFAPGDILMNSETVPAAIVGTLGADYSFTAGGALNADAKLISGDYAVITADATSGALTLDNAHTIVVDAGYPATCTQPGLTEGKHCSDCGEVLVAQEVIPAVGHEYVKLSDGLHMQKCTFDPTHNFVEEHDASCTACEDHGDNYCPFCGEVTWTEAVNTSSAYRLNNKDLHLRISKDVTNAGNWTFDIDGTNANKIHVFLDGGSMDFTVANNGTILLNTASANKEVKIFGSGAMETTSMSLISVRGSNQTVELMGGTYTSPEGRNVIQCGDASQMKDNNVIKIYEGTVLNGGIEARSMEVNIYGGTIHATTDKRAIQLNEKSPLNIYGGTITGGTSTGDAGNIYVANGNTMTMSGGTITGGTAKYGGNVYVTGTSTLIMTGGIIEDGVASVRGGNIFTDPNATVSIKGAAIIDGQAPNGGNISSSASIVIEKSTISGGNSSDSGGNLYFNGGSTQVVQIADTTIVGGSANVGANIHITQRSDDNYGSTAVLRNCTVGAPKSAEYASVGVYWGSKLVVIDGSIESHQKAVTLICNEANGSSRLVLAGKASVSGGRSGIEVDSHSTVAIDKNWTGEATVLFAKYFEVGEVLMNSELIPAAIVGTLDLTAAEIFVAGGELKGKLTMTGYGDNQIVTFDAAAGTLKLKEIDAVAIVAGVEYGDLNVALQSAKEGNLIKLVKDCTVDEIYIRMGRTLNLNGRTLTVTGEVTAANATANIIDTSNGEGCLVVGRNDVAFNYKNDYLPVWVEGEGFRFVEHVFETRFRTSQTHPDKEIPEGAVQFRFWLDGAIDCLLAQQLANGGSDNGIQVKVKLTWKNSAGFGCEQYFTFTDKLLQEYAANASEQVNWSTNVFHLTVMGAQSVTDLAFQPMIVLVDEEENEVVKSAAQTHVIQGELEQYVLQAGFGRVDVTPQLTNGYTVGMGGYGDAVQRTANGIQSNLYITCIAFRQEGETVLLYTVDNAALSGDALKIVRKAVAQETGIPESNHFYGATHTHSAPSLTFDADTNVPGAKEYSQLFLNGAVEAAKLAINDLTPSTMYTTSTVPKSASGKAMTFPRQYTLKNGNYTDAKPSSKWTDWNKPNYQSNYTGGYPTEADQNMVLIKLDRAAAGKQDILMVNFQAHVDHSSSLGVSDSFHKISADFPGAMRSKLENETDMLMAYFTGASGNLTYESPYSADKNGLSMQAYGERLATCAINALGSMQQQIGTGIEMKQSTYSAKVDHSKDNMIDDARVVYNTYAANGYDLEGTRSLALSKNMQSAYEARAIITRYECRATIDLEIKALRIGNIGFINGAYEMFSNESLAIRDVSPYDQTFVITGNSGYIGNSYAYGTFEVNGLSGLHNNYEAATGLYVKGTAEALRDEFISMLQRLQ